MGVEKKKDEPRPEDLIEKVEAPDDKDFDSRLEAVQSEMDKLQTEQQTLNKKISERSGGKDEYQKQRLDLRAQLDLWSAKMDEVKRRKEEITGKIEEDKQANIQAKSDLAKMKKSIGYGSEADIDDRIASIEFKLWTDTIPLKEEKALLKELSELKKSRPKVAQVKDMEANLQTGDKGQEKKATIKELNEENAMYFMEKKKVSEQLKELNEERAKQTGDMPEFIKQREAINAKIQEKIKERNTIRQERKEAEQAYRAYQAEIRKIKAERQAEERRERQKEYELRQLERKAEKLDEQPHVAEITLIEQTIAFCKSLVQAKGPEKKEEKKETNYALPEGATVVLKKEDREEEYYFAPTKTKASKSKNKGGKAEGSSKPIKHNAETFQLFDKLKLDAPITTDDIPPLLEKLEEQLADYQEKVKEWQASRDEMKRKILEGNAAEVEEND